MIIYLLFIAPAMLIAMAAQWWIHSAYKRTSGIPARMSGAMAARRILDANGLRDVPIEASPGFMSDHYDPSSKVVRLSPDVYSGHSIAAVGIAAHEVGHAIQDARSYAPLVLRNLAVPVANFGGSISSLVFMVAMGMLFAGLGKIAVVFLLFGIACFSATVIFQLVNLPVEFNASSRAKTELVSLGIVNGQELSNVNSVLNAAAMTYVAGTLQAISTLAYYVFQFLMVSGGIGRSDDA